MNFKQLNLDRTLIAQALEKTGAAVSLRDTSSETQLQYEAEKDGKKCIIDVYLVNNGTTTLTPRGNCTDLAIELCQAVVDETRIYELGEINQSIPVEKKIFDEVYEVLKNLYPDCIQENIISGGTQYRFLKDGDGQFVFKYFERRSILQLQGRALKFFMVLATALEEKGCNTLEWLLSGYMEVTPKVQGYELGRVYLPGLYEKLERPVQKILEPSLHMIKVNIKLPEYSIILVPVLKVMEHVIRTVLQDCGYSISDRESLSMFSKQAYTGLHRLDDTLNGVTVNADTKVNLEKCYNFYAENRHTLFHTGTDLLNIKIIENREDAIGLLSESLELLEMMKDDFQS